MAQVLLLKNQYQQILNKSGDWVNYDDGKSFFFSHHRDEIINQKVELAVKAPDLRLEVVEAERDLKGNISIPEGGIDLEKLVRISHQDDTQEDIFASASEAPANTDAPKVHEGSNETQTDNSERAHSAEDGSASIEPPVEASHSVA